MPALPVVSGRGRVTSRTLAVQGVPAETPALPVQCEARSSDSVSVPLRWLARRRCRQDASAFPLASAGRLRENGPRELDGMQAFILGLREHGLATEEIDHMCRTNPAELLGTTRVPATKGGDQR